MTNSFGAVLYANNVARVASFYEAVADLHVAEADTSWVRLRSPSADFELVVHGIPAHIAASIHIATPPDIREDTPIKLVLPARSLTLARDAADRLGGAVFPDARAWSQAGFLHCDGYDPEGNVFQLRVLTR
ncbi:MAG: hypothetical protein JNL19_04115 [Burkholderiales bacterium]|nr:hypothetical protein [Burkholderiales bacterium]